MYEIPVFCVLYRCNLTLAITMEHSNSQNNPFIYLVNKLLEDSFINLPKTAFFFKPWSHLVLFDFWNSTEQDLVLFC